MMGNGITRSAGAALLFFSKAISGVPLSEVSVQDLNWVLDSTIWSLGHALDPSDLRSFLSAEELRAIEGKIQELSKCDGFDLDSIRAAIEARTSLLSDLGSEKEAASVRHKIGVLVEVALRAGPEAATARAALLYVAEEEDIVSDAYGYLGLLDDLYVIEWAYAAVEDQTRCLPLLDALLREWPFVAEAPILKGGSAVLDRFSQFVCCMALFILRQQQENGLLVVREVGPYAILAALMAAIACAREEARRAGRDAISNWTSGEPVTISDGVSAFRAIFLGSTEISGRTRYRLGVRDAGSLTVDQSILPYIARAVGRDMDKKLSRGNDILAWMKDRHLDPLFFLTGATRHQIKNIQSILLLGARHKLDCYLAHLQLLPTGGGKTEAYLGLAAFSICFERMSGSPPGTTVLMRYTLRLLTSQQFQRAAALVLALETLRRDRELGANLGSSEISIGLWVGQSLSPNSRDQARAALKRMKQQDKTKQNPFQLLRCAWCGLRLDDPHALGYRDTVVSGGSERTVRFVCPDVECRFGEHSHGLPVLVIDEDIYHLPPTILIGTVDKFAQIAWDDQVGRIFGTGTGAPPPALVIQDELHLISGPLGTIVGLYETAIRPEIRW